MYNGAGAVLLRLFWFFFILPADAPQPEPSPGVVPLGLPENPNRLVLALARGVLVHPAAFPVVYSPHGRSSVCQCLSAVLSLILLSRSAMRSSLDATLSTALRSPNTASTKPADINTMAMPMFSILCLSFLCCAYISFFSSFSPPSATTTHAVTLYCSSVKLDESTLLPYSAYFLSIHLAASSRALPCHVNV